MASVSVVLANCPGCKKSLRMPGEWLNQAIRCKHCGIVMQARRVSAPPLPPPPTNALRPTPPPPTRPPVAPSPHAFQAPPVVPPPVVPPPVAAPVTATPRPAVPMAQPVQAQRPTQAFDFQQPAEVEGPSGRKRRSGMGIGAWIALGVLALLLGAGGVLALVNRERISEFASNIFKGPKEEAGKGGKGKRKWGGNSGSGKGGSKGAGGAGGPAVASGTKFPRRALLISVHNYLYLNPITAGPSGSNDFGVLAAALSNQLNVPYKQIIHLSDVSALKEYQPRPPLKDVIKETIQAFLKTCRKQDRVIVLFSGHTTEVEGKAYLVPLEGELGDAKTLIPLSWVFAELAKADCRQKVLLLDGNRHNSAQGEVRPTPGPMTEAFEKELARPPAGVEVWAGCSRGQRCHEFDDAPLGLFLDSLRQSLRPDDSGKSALDGQIQSPNDPIPLARLVADVNGRMASNRNKVTQKSLVFGKAPASGADYDKNEALAKVPALPTVKGANERAINELLADISVPSLKGTKGSAADLSFGNLPPFPEETMKKFQGDLPKDHPLRKAVHEARVALWAIARSDVPADLQADVTSARKSLSVDLNVLEDKVNRPAGGAMGEQRFKAGFFDRSAKVARIVARLEDVLERLEEAGKAELDKAPPRWQANYDYMLGRFKAQLAYLEEYNGLLGQMRKELPPAEMHHLGWRVASKEKAGDTMGKKYDRAARKLYDQLAKKNKKTPYEVLAKREKMTALGMEWQPF